jgi:predicted MPP superfamily phosphohydrolase
MLSYFSLATLVTLATHWWFERRLVAASALSMGWTRMLRGLLLANVLVLPGVLVLVLRAPAAWSPWAVPLGRAAFLDEGFCLLLCGALAPRDLAWLVVGAIQKTRARLRPTPVPDLERRRALLVLRASGVAVAGLAAGVTVVAHERAIALPAVSRVPLPIANLPPPLRGLRIAQISDLHVGPTLRGDTVASIVAQVNALAPDVVVVTGDLIDGFVSQLASEVAALAGLRAPLGCFFVTGNHEYFYRADEWVTHLAQLGCAVLLNAHQVVERDGARLLIAGVCDQSGQEHLPGHAHDLDAALAGAPSVDVRVLLAHRPDCAERAAARGFDAQLSGHLHGGQFFPLTAALRATHAHVAGLYDVGGMHLFVSRGAGYWGPSLRLDAPQELTLFELVERAS